MRCVICNKSDNGLSDYLPDSGYAKDFYEDPKDKIGHICSECAEAHIELMHEFYLEDEE